MDRRNRRKKHDRSYEFVDNDGYEQRILESEESSEDSQALDFTRADMFNGGFSFGDQGRQPNIPRPNARGNGFRPGQCQYVSGTPRSANTYFETSPAFYKDILRSMYTLITMMYDNYEEITTMDGYAFMRQGSTLVLVKRNEELILYHDESVKSACLKVILVDCQIKILYMLYIYDMSPTPGRFPSWPERVFRRKSRTIEPSDYQKIRQVISDKLSEEELVCVIKSIESMDFYIVQITVLNGTPAEQVVPNGSAAAPSDEPFASVENPSHSSDDDTGKNISAKRSEKKTNYEFYLLKKLKNLSGKCNRMEEQDEENIPILLANRNETLFLHKICNFGLSKGVANAMDKKEIVYPKEGTLFVARMVDNDYWYRGIILPNNKVYFFDLGIHVPKNKIKTLFEDMSDMPTITYQCSVDLPSDLSVSIDAETDLELKNVPIQVTGGVARVKFF